MVLAQVPIGKEMPGLVNAIIEIPRGSNMKYEYDKELGIIRLGRVLYSPSFYPVDYGLVPQTRIASGDHLDVMVIVNEPSFPGCVLTARPLGVLHMADENGPDDKIIAVSAADPRFDDVTSLETLSPHVLSEIRHFFQVYKALEDKHVTVQGWGDLRAAHQAIADAHAAWQAAAAGSLT